MYVLWVDVREREERGMFCLSTEGQEFIDLRLTGQMHIDSRNSEITRTLSREGGKVH